MATVTHLAAEGDTQNLNSYVPRAAGADATITPGTGVLIIVIAAVSGSTIAGGGAFTCSDNRGGSYTRALTALSATSANQHAVFIRTANTTSALSHTITVSVSGDTGTGAVIDIKTIPGMTRFGANAIRSVSGTPNAQTRDNNGTGTAPTFTLPNAPLTTNPIITWINCATNPTAMTQPTSYTKDVDTGYATPTQGYISAHRNSGQTTTSVAWSNPAPSQWGGGAFELDVSTDMTVAAETGAASIEAPVLTQAHAIVVANESQAAAIESPTVSLSTDLVVAGEAGAASVANVALTQAHSLAVSAVLGAASLASVTLTQEHALAIASMLGSSTEGTVSLTGTHSLTVAGMVQSAGISSPALSGEQNLDVSSLAAAEAVEALVLTQAGSLVVSDLHELQALDPVSLSQSHFLTVDALQGLSTEGSVVLQVAIPLLVQDLGEHSTLQMLTILQILAPDITITVLGPFGSPLTVNGPDGAILVIAGPRVTPVTATGPRS
jgi:hypothetical protein